MLSTDLLANADHWDGTGPWWPIFPLMWFAFFIIAALIFMRAGRRRWDRHGACTGETKLAERFAAGEIDEAEYRERRAVLREQEK